MSELHFDIDLVPEPKKRASPSWRRNVRQIVVAVCGAGILAGASSTRSHRNPACQACYECALKKNAQLGGDYRLSFTVNAKGAVANARVAPRDGDGLGNCLQHVVKRIRFNAPPSPIDVSRKL